VSGTHLARLGEGAWLISFEPRLAPDVNDRVLAVAGKVAERLGDRVRDIVPAAASLAVHFDAVTVDADNVGDVLRECLTAPAVDATARVVELPVWYDESVGPDLPLVADFAGCTTDEVIRRHAGGRYRVFMLGFLPGFPYLGLVDERIAMPRRASPRAHVPRGSVAIAGRQTGVYPADSPGGWQIVGRTPLALFDLRADPPARLRPGDEVRFVPIDGPEFERLARST
jgi:KipI family sensor histidine kinase inhibitor